MEPGEKPGGSGGKPTGTDSSGGQPGGSGVRPEGRPGRPVGSVGKPSCPGGSGWDSPASLKRTREEDEEEMRLDMDVGEIFPCGGITGKVVRITNQQGEIVVADERKGNLEVLFHVNQVHRILFSELWGRTRLFALTTLNSLCYEGDAYFKRRIF